MSSKILNFSKDRLITGINIVDGMLFFTDNHTEPKKINIEKFKGNDPEVAVDHSTGTTSIYGRTFAEADITVIKGHPKHALDTNLTDDPIDGGGDVIDLDPSPVASVFFIETHFPTTSSFSNINVRGRLIPGNKQILSQGFYYTFSDSFGDRNDPEDINGLITNRGNGVYDTNDIAQDSGFYEFNISSSEAQSQGAVAGGYIHYIAYCVVSETSGGGRFGSNEFYFAKEKRSYQLTDTTQAPTGSISDLEITIVKNDSFGGGIINANVFASCNNTSNSNIVDLFKGFVFSKAYREIDNPTTPTIANINTHVQNREANSQELFPQRYFRPTEIQSSLLNRDKFFLQGGVDFSRLNTGDVYFVYAFIELDGGGFVYSSVEKLIVDTNVSSEGPGIWHLPADVQETEVGLNANVWSAGGDADLTERGFIFSTEVDSINTVNTIFNDFSNTAPYAYNGSLQINNTFRVPVAIPTGKTGTEQSGDGSGQLHVSTANHLTNLLGGTTLYYIAYAINSRGQRSYASVDALDTFNNGPDGMLSVVTSENVIPRIQAGGWNLFKQEINGPFEPIFTFKILGGIADPTKVTSMGIEYAYATGSDPEYGITHDNLIKFAENEEHTKIENSGTNINLDVSQFDYTGEDADEIIGEFKIKDGYGIADSIANNPEDYELVEQIRLDRGDTFLEAFGYTHQRPFAKTLSYYAYVWYDGIKYKSKISRGWSKANSLIWGDLTNYTPRYCGVDGISWPTFFSGGRDASKTHLPEKPPTGGTAQIFGAMCPNAPHRNTVGGSLQELGFYWSYEPIPTDDATFDKLTAWANKSTTNKVSATSPGGSSGPNVTDPTNPTNQSTAAKNWHVGSSQDERGHFEFSATIGPFAAGKTKVYWIPYLLPQPVAAHRGLFHLGATPVDRFGTSSGGDLLNSFNIGSSITAIDVAPLVKIKNVDNTYSDKLVFTGKAEPGSGNYNINRKGFYIKLKSEFTNPTNAASVKTEMAINTNRTTLDTDQFNPGSEYGKTSTFSPGTYLASAFCQIVLADANGVDQTYTVISDNNIESTVGTPPPVDVDTTPVVINIGVGDNMRGNITDNKGVAISSKGFYVLEVKGSFNSNLQKPVDGNALKAIFNNASNLSDVTAINVSPTTIDGADSSVFRNSVPNQRRGYVYYYAAYAINSKSEEDISNTVKHIEYPEIINSFIEIFPIPLSNTIYANNIGKVSSTGGNSYENTVSLKVTTESDSLANFYMDVSNWTSGNRITSINKRSSSTGNFLDINLIDQNFSTQPRECTLKIYNATDPSKVIVLSIFQEGNSDTGDEFQGPREGNDIRHAGGFRAALPNPY